MIKRPKRTDSEKEVLQMQLEFLREKEKNSNFQPAAKIIKIQTEKPEKRQSEFAKKRGHKPVKEPQNHENVPLVIGDILERENKMEIDNIPETSSTSVNPFPVPEKIDPTLKPEKGQSLFARMRQMNKPLKAPEPMEIDFGHQSFVVSGEEAQQIHKENLNILVKMSEEELKEERQKLIESLDPGILTFLRSKREGCQKLDEKPVPKPGKKEEFRPEILQTENSDQWINFNQVEEDKLEWMKDVPVQIPKLKPGEMYEARFDWKGVLLPYVCEITDDNRDLYLHGDEPHRAGFTLQELFRLARSEVMQQRISALGAISGMLSIYNQGFYDQVLDLPITTMFFLLRFALDDKAVPIVDMAANALANLFYNASDEYLLDTLCYSKLGQIEPSFGDQEGTVIELDKKMNKMNLSDCLKTSIEEDEMSKEEKLNDFHLAETDLVKCLLRTNILERIRYILTVLKPDGQFKLHVSCVQILIRLARSGNEAKDAILNTEGLMEFLFHELDSKDKPRQSTVILKLFRILLVSPNLSKIWIEKLLDKTRNIVCNREDLTVSSIQVQLVAIRLLIIIFSHPCYGVHRDFEPAIRYLLEWHYQYLGLEDTKGILLHQHATAVVALLNHRQFSWDRNLCSEVLGLCFRKWLTIYLKMIKDKNSQITMSQNVLLTTCLEFCLGNSEAYFVIKDDLQNLINDKCFIDRLMNRITELSGILSYASDRHEVLSFLPNLGGVAFDNKFTPNLVLSLNSASMLANVVIQLMLKFSIDRQEISQAIEQHLMVFSKDADLLKKIQSNWFYRHDLELVFNAIKMPTINRSLTLCIACQLIPLTLSDEMDKLNYLLDTLLFNPESYIDKLNYDNADILAWKDIFIYFYQMKKETGINSKTLFRSKWVIDILNIIYEQHVETSKEINFILEKDTEHRLISASMGMANLLSANGIKTNSLEDNLMHLMMPFLSMECRFLEPNIKAILLERAMRLGPEIKTNSLNLTNIKIDNKFNFESFYTVFLNHFQGSGYGDKLFSALVMLPLSIRFDVKYRKMVWSEHVAVLRFVNCNEDELIFSTFQDFVAQPKEDLKSDPNYESSLIKCYSQAISSHLLRPGSVPFKIADYYLGQLKERKIIKKT